MMLGVVLRALTLLSGEEEESVGWKVAFAYACLLRRL